MDKLYTHVTIKEQDFCIKKFTAKTGLKIARMVIAKAAPLIPFLEKMSTGKKPAPANGEAIEQPKEEPMTAEEEQRMYDAVGTLMESLSDEDMDTLVDHCMRVCYLNLPAGLQEVLDETGHYGVPDVEYDMMLTLRLCVEAIKWGASDFFGDKNSALSQMIGRAGSLLSR